MFIMVGSGGFMASFSVRGDTLISSTLRRKRGCRGSKIPAVPSLRDFAIADGDKAHSAKDSFSPCGSDPGEIASMRGVDLPVEASRRIVAD
jgi:hypothetical protein